MQLNRRELLSAVTAAFASPTLQLTAAEPGKPLFFTPDEFAMLDCLTELIVPTDDHSPGAHAAGVAAYIDKTAAEALDPGSKTSWQKGLHKVNEASQESYNLSFVKTTAAQQSELLSKMERANDPFFGQLKETTAFAYYSSSIGIHEEMQYKGNVILEQFAGYDAT